MDPHLWAFVGLAALLTIMPGADMALVTRSTLAGGRRAAFLTTLGINLGCLVHATASAFGISAILRTSALAFTVVKTIGAAYLVFIGIRAIVDTWRERNLSQDTSPTLGAERGGGISARRAFSEGLMTNVLNPKVAIFYLTLLPQFIEPGDPVLLKSLALGTIHNVMGFVWLTMYAWFIDQFSAFLNRPTVKQTLERITGAVLIALGVRLAWEKR
ncbi:MAG TPA: LysE family translocator [Gemmatimonadaceae bacterium]|nr:LysE family translocator [Gemmatimonadaceae bacterium]